MVFSIDKLSSILYTYYQTNEFVQSEAKDTYRKNISNLVSEIIGSKSDKKSHYNVFFKIENEKNGYSISNNVFLVIMFLSMTIDTFYSKESKFLKKDSPFSRIKKLDSYVLSDMTEENKSSILGKFESYCTFIFANMITNDEDENNYVIYYDENRKTLINYLNSYNTDFLLSSLLQKDTIDLCSNQNKKEYEKYLEEFKVLDSFCVDSAFHELNIRGELAKNEIDLLLSTSSPYTFVTLTNNELVKIVTTAEKLLILTNAILEFEDYIEQTFPNYNASNKINYYKNININSFSYLKNMYNLINYPDVALENTTKNFSNSLIKLVSLHK